MIFIEWSLALLGHLAIACVLFNHVHAFASPRYAGKESRKLTEKFILVLAFLPIPWLLYAFATAPNLDVSHYGKWFLYYVNIVKFVGAYFVLRWIYRTITRKLPSTATMVSFSTIDIQNDFEQNLLHGLKAQILSWLPWNQVTLLRIENWKFTFTNLPKDLDGITICQMSDLHFTGLIDRNYFKRVVDMVNEQSPDLIFITGDIVDCDECVGWVSEVLSKLRSKYGVFFVLGNHDQMVTNQHEYRQEFSKLGFISAAEGKWHTIRIGSAELLVSGNEIPWYLRATKLPANNEPRENQFSILLSHSPDQIGWAVNRNFDLMFAGHTHGGQIRLPIVGPIIAPSRYGIKYASGTFKIRDTMMHVSRGISGDEPIRINCPPELGFFTLARSPKSR